MSDDELNDFLNCYSSKSTTSMFKTQLHKIKAVAPVTDKFEIGVDSKVTITKEDCFNNVLTVVSRDTSNEIIVNDINACDITRQLDSATLNHQFNKSNCANETLSSDCDVVYCNADLRGATFGREENVNNGEILVNSDCEVVSYVEEPEPVRRYPTRSKRKLQTRLPKPPCSRKRMKQNDRINVKESLNNSIQEDEFNYEITVKVLWKSVNVNKFNIRKFQKIELIYDHFAKIECLNKDEILLTLNGKEVRPLDTPDSLNITVVDFIEGGIVKGRKEDTASADNEKKEGRFIIKLQEEKKILQFPVDPKEPMKVLMTKFSEQVNRPCGTFKVIFDGDAVHSSDTPMSLGLESGEILDIVSC